MAKLTEAPPIAETPANPASPARNVPLRPLRRRQRHVHDRQVQHHHQLRQPDHAQHQPPPPVPPAARSRGIRHHNHHFFPCRYRTRAEVWYTYDVITALIVQRIWGNVKAPGEAQ
jgi:hypothetical protein